jgi:predicted acylesterase/phospholipase RssA
MADLDKKTNGLSPFDAEAFDPTLLPDFDTEFISRDDLEEFRKALNAPESTPVTALNDWRPIHQRVRRKKSGRKEKAPKRSKDETREGIVYSVLKWPMLLVVFGWILALGLSYLVTRLYIWAYERMVTWRGRREKLRQVIRSKTNYTDWMKAAKELDAYLGNEKWKETDDYAYYDYATVKRVQEQLKQRRERASFSSRRHKDGKTAQQALDELKGLVEACVKNNFAGIENPRIYSETYYGTKHLVQAFIDELEVSLSFLFKSPLLSQDEKYKLARHLHTNFGRTALCLSGGASFAYYHFGVVKALLDAKLLPDVITGTSGGALIAALVATRTDDELKQLLVPALAHHINACKDSFFVWSARWWRTGARFDSIEWARQCSWFCRGSTTFREAYERTGRILNVSCVPSDPHSPTILTNYLTAPDCVIWSAVLASAAVPGILNPVVLMTKTRDGTLAPYSFGHKWKDGSLRTDIPLKALNTHFNVNFSIVSQVNPHINLFFFSSRGTVGRPVTHRRGRGWRGGFLGSATEQYLKLDLNKWLKVLRHLELLPRPLGQDWSNIWLQNFSGTITIWPKSRVSDFWYILSDPTPERLAKMLQVGQQSTFPKLLFIANRMKIERLVEEGLLLGMAGSRKGSMSLRGPAKRLPAIETDGAGDWRDRNGEGDKKLLEAQAKEERRLSSPSVIEELKWQSGVFFDDSEVDTEGTEEDEGVEVVENGGTRVG